jgi:ribosomal protein S18 acetylase RimI-like enzyme
MIRPLARSDKSVVMELIAATSFFRPEEVHVAEELIDIYLNHPVGTYDLYWMAVSPHHQGKGYGRKLVEWLETRVREIGGRLIIIETSSTPKYEPTRRFYLGLNYPEVARIPDYYQDGDDRVIYVKRMD